MLREPTLRGGDWIAQQREAARLEAAGARAKGAVLVVDGGQQIFSGIESVAAHALLEIIAAPGGTSLLRGLQLAIGRLLDLQLADAKGCNQPNVKRMTHGLGGTREPAATPARVVPG